MRRTREMFTEATATAHGPRRIYADPVTGAVVGQIGEWGQCLRGTGPAVCRRLDRATTDIDAFRDAGGMATLDDEPGAVIAAGSLQYGPPHPPTRRRDAEALMFELARPENMAARVVPHLTEWGVSVAGAISDAAIAKWGTVAGAARAINETAWSLHAGQSQDNPGMNELWGVVAVGQSGFRHRAPDFAMAATNAMTVPLESVALAAACDGATPCDACATAAAATEAPEHGNLIGVDDLDAIADRVVAKLDAAREAAELAERAAKVEPLKRLG